MSTERNSDEGRSKQPIYTADPSHTSKKAVDILMYINTHDFVRFIWHYWDYIDWRGKWWKVLIKLIGSLFFSIVVALDEFFYGKALRQAQMNDEPVFILGHNRSGTTLTHNLLTQDKEEFSFPDTLTCAMPRGSLNPLMQRRKDIDKVVKKFRPMDNMRLGLHLPQEDEFGIMINSGGISTWAAFVFPAAHKKIVSEYLSLEKASPKDRQSFVEGFQRLCQRIALHADGRRVIFKSPGHTAKIKVMLELYPKAQFVYLHRNPYRVFLSFIRTVDVTFWPCFLSTATSDDICEFVLSYYETMINTYLDTRALIPEGNLIEVKYADLNNDKRATVKRVYNHFGWDFTRMEPQLDAYLHTISDYKRNELLTVTSAQREAINSRWGRAFEAWGYEMIPEGDVDVSAM